MTEGALGCGRRTIACLLRKPIHVSLSCFVMVRGERPVSGRAGRAAVAACHGMSYLLMLCHGSDGGRPPGGRRGRAVGSGKDMGGGSFVQFVFIRRPGPASERPFTARICVRARARVGAGAVRAPDCPRARQAQGALRLSAESGSFRTGPARAGRGSGCRFPRTHHSTFSENASILGKYYINFSNNLLFTPAGRRIPMSSQELVWIG